MSASNAGPKSVAGRKKWVWTSTIILPPSFE
jgi:hypothetical protein